MMRLLAVTIALVSVACGSETDLAEVTPETGPNIVPSALGSYEEMWAPLRELQTLHQPLSTASAAQMPGEVNPQPMIISEQSPEGQTLWLVLYTDRDLLAPETYTIDQSVANALESALYTEEVTGATFNPFTTVSSQEVFNYSVDKLYLAGLVGYLTARPAEPGRHWEAANAARQAGSPFETLHHALLSLSDGEEWSRCELPKIWAMWELDFPGSRDMALDELTWFMGEGNDTPEARAMLEDFRNSSRAESK